MYLFSFSSDHKLRLIKQCLFLSSQFHRKIHHGVTGPLLEAETDGSEFSSGGSGENSSKLTLVRNQRLHVEGLLAGTTLLSSFRLQYFLTEDFPGGSVVKNPPANAGDQGSLPRWGKSPGDGNSYTLQYSCLENSMDRGAW